MILNNLLVETFRKKWNVKSVVTADATGYSLTMTNHYTLMRGKNGESVKKRWFVYSFALIDLNTVM